jgi:hypothetical protein
MKLIYGAHATHFHTDKKRKIYHTRKVEQLVPLSVRLTHIRLLKETFGFLYILLNKHKKIQIIKHIQIRRTVKKNVDFF